MFALFVQEGLSQERQHQQQQPQSSSGRSDHELAIQHELVKGWKEGKDIRVRAAAVAAAEQQRHRQDASDSAWEERRYLNHRKLELVRQVKVCLMTNLLFPYLVVVSNLASMCLLVCCTYHAYRKPTEVVHTSTISALSQRQGGVVKVCV